MISCVKHNDLVRALARRGVIVVKPTYVPGEMTKPVALGVRSTTVSGEVLRAALAEAHCEELRLICIGTKQPLKQFAELIQRHGATGDCNVDIGANFIAPTWSAVRGEVVLNHQPNQLASIWLFFVANRKAKSWTCWNLLERHGSAEAASKVIEWLSDDVQRDIVECGTVFLKGKWPIGAGVNVRKICMYPGGLVHYWKLSDVNWRYEHCRSIAVMRSARDALSKSINDVLTNPK